MPAPRPAEPVFEIWQAGPRIVSIDHPVRLAVLRELEARPATLGQLAKAVGKAKSTLSSLLLPPLLRAGLVAAARDPKDARVKWYRLQGSRLGSSAVDAAQLREAVVGFVASRGLVPLRTALDLLDVPRLVEAAEPSYLEGAARRLGAMVGAMLSASTPAARLEELSGILAREGLGRLAGRGRGLHLEGGPPNARRFLVGVAHAALAAQPAS